MDHHNHSDPDSAKTESTARQQSVNRVADIKRRLRRLALWTWHARPARRGLRLLQRVIRVGVHVVREISGGQIQLNAMSLSYTTLLSLVPLLAVTFSVLKAFGSNNAIEPFLNSLLAPLGSSAVPLVSQIMEFVSHIKVGVLGAVGIGLLFYTVISLMQKIERVLNDIWQVRQLRQLSARFSSYLSVLLVGPVLVLAATGLTATLLATPVIQTITNATPLGGLVANLTWVGPAIMWVAAFTFLYGFIPNTRVQFSAALVGGIVAAALWNLTGFVFGGLIAGSTNYTAIYSAFASLVLFMVWLQIAWMIVLFGASVSYAWQNWTRIRSDRGRRTDTPARQMLAAIEVMTCVASQFDKGNIPPTSDDIKQQLGEDMDIEFEQTDRALEQLQRANLIRATNENDPGWVPALPPAQINLKRLSAAVYGEIPLVHDRQATTARSWLEAETRYREDILSDLIVDHTPTSYQADSKSHSKTEQQRTRQSHDAG